MTFQNGLMYRRKEKGEGKGMASVEKFGKGAVAHQIRHIERITENFSNEDIDKSKISNDLMLTPSRGISSFDYYKQRLEECRVLNRKDVKTCFGWIITVPEDVPQSMEDLFFFNVYDFLCGRYGGEKNCVSAVVHKDESGRSHLHWLGMPIVGDEKKGIEKICCKEVLNRKDLRNFHPDLDRFLRNRGMNCSVYTGVTAAQGGNRTVREMKAERAVERGRETERRW